MFNVLLTVAATWNVAVVDFDPSIHKYVALLETTTQHGTYAASLESITPFNFKENKKVDANLVLVCETGLGVDESTSNMCNCEVTYRKYICNVKQMEFL